MQYLYVMKDGSIIASDAEAAFLDGRFLSGSRPIGSGYGDGYRCATATIEYPDGRIISGLTDIVFEKAHVMSYAKREKQLNILDNSGD